MPAIHAIQQDKPAINGRQLCFFAAFLIPVSKFLSAPAALAFFAKGDLLVPALTHYLLQAAILAVILFLASRTDKSFFDLLSDTFGVLTARIVYILYSLYFIFFMLLPILNVERFVYSAFFDTAPYLFAFTPFFFLSGFICTKNLKSFGRCADIAFPLFIVSFVGLMVLSGGEADFTNILPMFGTPFKSTGNAIVRTFGQFSDTALFLPLLGTYRYKKGDGKKIMLSYGLGAVFVLFFLAVFYGIFASLAPKQPYAFAKIGQYFGALSVVGRFDLLLTYLMTVVLLFYCCFPLQLSVHCFCKAVNTERKVWVSAALNIGLLAFSILSTKYYNVLYETIMGKLFWIFILFADLVPLLALCLRRRDSGKEAPKKKKTKKEATYA